MLVSISPKFRRTDGFTQIGGCVIEDNVAKVELPDNFLVATMENLGELGHNKGIEKLGMDAFGGPGFQVGYANGGLLWLQVQDQKIVIKYYKGSPEESALLEQEVVVPQLSIDKEGETDGE